MTALGCLLMALAINAFFVQHHFLSGGISGVAIILYYLTGWPPGITSLVFNIPLFWIAWKYMSRQFFINSVIGTVLFSLALDGTAFVQAYVAIPDKLLCSIAGGALGGLGSALVYRSEASTGGVDIVARLLKLKFRNFPIGKLLLCMDLCTAVATGIVYKQFNNTLYSVVTLVLSSIMLDKVVYGMDYSKVALIISDRYEEIARAIDSQLDRGVTLLQGQGFYLRSDKYVLLSAVKRKQLAQLKDLVISIDPSAFIILQDAHQVLGDGFKRYDRNEL